jgi:hypothetical protein
MAVPEIAGEKKASGRFTQGEAHEGIIAGLSGGDSRSVGST